MRAVRAGALIGAAVVAAVLGANAINCASATTITLDVRANPSLCGQGELTINETGIVASSLEKYADPEKAALQQFETGCPDGNGRIGTLVITPASSADREDKIGIRVVAGLGKKTASDCDDGSGVVGDDCIIAKREVKFVKGANVPYTITLDGNCIHVSCPDGYECDPDKPYDQRCVPIGDISSPGSSSSGGPEKDVNVAPIDTGPGDQEDAEAGPPSPRDLCENGRPGRTYNEAAHSCTIDCAQSTDCQTTNVCPPDQDCTLLCNKTEGCKNANCSATKGACTFDCTGGNGNNQCENITCDAGKCIVKCATNTTACSAVTLQGHDNQMTCTKKDDQPTCNDVRCIPGPGQTPPTTCARSCDGPDAGGCGTKSICDAGSCAAFEVNDSGPP